MSDKPEYIEIEWRIRCDGWWRKAIIGLAAVVAVAIVILGALR